MQYKVQIYDKDVGGFVCDNKYDNLNDVISEVVDIVSYDFESDCEFEDDVDAYLSECKQFDFKEIVKSLKSFKFNEFCSWSCDLPGHHRKIIVCLTCVNSNTNMVDGLIVENERLKKCTNGDCEKRKLGAEPCSDCLIYKLEEELKSCRKDFNQFEVDQMLNGNC